VHQIKQFSKILITSIKPTNFYFDLDLQTSSWF